MANDKQLVELLGRSLLQHALLTAGIEVAIPVRDRGVDLIAYYDIGSKGEFHARSLQIKAFSKEAFSFDRKYKKFSDLIIIYIWNVSIKGNARFFVMN